MNQIPNPDSWMDVATILVAVAMMTVPSWFAMKAHKSSEQVRNQVVNGHADAPPLRQDLDRAIASIEQLGQEVRGIRQDMIHEEDRRRSHIDELRSEVDRRFAELHKRIS